MWTFARNTKSMSLAHNFSTPYFAAGSSKVLLFHFLFIVFQIAKKVTVKWKRFIARQLSLCDYMKTLFAYAAGGIYTRNPVMWLHFSLQILQDIPIASPIKSLSQRFSINHLAVSLAGLFTPRAAGNPSMPKEAVLVLSVWQRWDCPGRKTSLGKSWGWEKCSWDLLPFLGLTECFESRWQYGVEWQ